MSEQSKLFFILYISVILFSQPSLSGRIFLYDKTIKFIKNKIKKPSIKFLYFIIIFYLLILYIVKY